MFETIDQARDEIRKLDDEQLAELTVLTLTEHALGRITEQQAEFVSALIIDVMMERAEVWFAEMELDQGATVN